MNNRELVDIFERSTSIAERSGPDFVAVNGSNQQTEILFARWLKIAAAGNEDWFQERLSWDGLDQKTARKLVGPVHYVSDRELPEWSKLLQELVLYCSKLPMLNEVSLDSGVPFRELYDRWVSFAVSKLDVSRIRITDAAFQSLTQILFNRIDHRCFPALRDEGKEFAAAKLGLAVEMLSERPSPEIYHAFIQRVISDGSKKLFTDFPVLARFLCSLINNWIEFVREFLVRLESDWELLNSLGWFGEPATVIHLESTAADVHARGRAVLIVSFDTGAKVVYKPRNVSVDALWEVAIRRVNLGGGFDLRAARVADRGDYGWVEFIERSQCRNQEEYARFFERGGAFLALVYALCGQDFHFENVIHSGEHPVLIDLEGLLQAPPRFISRSQQHDSDKLTDHLAYGVHLTSLLPGGFRFGINFGGLCGGRTLDDAAAALLPQRFEEQLIAGFTRMYRYLMQNSSVLLATFGLEFGPPLQQRFLFRNTDLYAELLAKISTRAVLRDSGVAVVILESLSRAFLVYPFSQRFRGILRAEHRALFQSDIPMFTTVSDQRSLYTDDGVEIADAFELSPAENVKRNLSMLTNEGLEHQILRIQSSLALPALNLACDSEFAPFGISACNQISTLSPEYEESDNAHSSMIAAYCDSRLRAIMYPESLARKPVIRWTFSFISSAFCYDQPNSTLSLFDGLMGIALFASAMGKSLGSSLGYKMTDAVVEFLGDSVAENSLGQFMRLRGISAITGVLGISYAAAQIGRMMHRQELTDAAVRIASMIPEAEFDRMQSVELYGGYAGVLNVLCSVASIADQSNLLKKADQLAARIVNSELMSELLDCDRIHSRKGRPLWGLATGATGIGYALMRTGHRCQRDDLTDLGKQLIEADLRRFKLESLMKLLVAKGLLLSSSFGVPGINAVLNALRSQNQFVSVPLRAEESEFVLATDQVCIGEMGRAEQYLCSQESCDVENARMIVGCFLARFQETGGERCFAGGVFNQLHPGLFQGVSGIGYQVLRSLDPLEIRSFLLLD